MTSNFRYLPRFTPGGLALDPIIPIIFTNPRNGWNCEVECLVDSGASTTILNEGIAQKLHIDINTGKERIFRGIQEISVIGYSHILLMQLKTDPHQFEIDCGFVPDVRFGGILGQKGFFDNYRVVFEGYNQRLEVTPVLF